MTLGNLVLAWTVAASSAIASAAGPLPPVQTVTAQEYQVHLQKLETLISKCAKDTTRQACLPSGVGPDDNVGTVIGARHVSYAWVRNVLDIAASSKSAKSTQKDHADVIRLLDEAQNRLQQEQRVGGGQPADQGDALQIARSQAKRTLSSILATSEFKRVTQPSLFARAVNRVLQWLDRRLAHVAADPRRARWLTRLFLGTVVLGSCTALLWWFVAQSRRQGLGFLPAPNESLGNSPSARDWRRWRDEAQELSQSGRWREAIHGLYWATIARLESKGLYSADRTRTPREYLAILRPGNEDRSELDALTRSFECIWYGHYPAGKQEYEQARVLFERLASR
jgi:Domain of unknown function (DUF4129)